MIETEERQNYRIKSGSKRATKRARQRETKSAQFVNPTRVQTCYWSRLCHDHPLSQHSHLSLQPLCPLLSAVRCKLYLFHVFSVSYSYSTPGCNQINATLMKCARHLRAICLVLLYLSSKLLISSTSREVSGFSENRLGNFQDLYKFLSPKSAHIHS